MAGLSDAAVPPRAVEQNNTYETERSTTVRKNMLLAVASTDALVAAVWTTTQSHS